MSNDFPVLLLPKRYEALQEQAESKHASIAKIVYRVDDAATRVEDLLRQVRDGGIGRFEVFLGKSGSGKTTFFRTLTLPLMAQRSTSSNRCFHAEQLVSCSS